MTAQDNQQPSSDDSTLIQGKLLLDLGFLEIFQLKEFSKKTPAVAALIRKANNPKIKSKIQKVLNIPGAKANRKEAIPLLRRLLKTLGLKIQKPRRNSQGTRFYRIIPEDDNILLIFQSILGLKDEDKFIEICQSFFERSNPKTESNSWENSGVYKIICLSTGNFYIGCCQNFRSRFRQHKPS
jgi:hypothetical protein